MTTEPNWGGFADVAVQCYRMRIGHMTYEEIARELGIDEISARNCARAVAYWKGVKLDGPKTYICPIRR